MNSFQPTEQRLAVTLRHYPAFPREPAILVRLVKHIYKRVHDDANAVLKPWGISHPEYNILMMMYGTEGYTLNPSQLADAAGEKSANITRLSNQLCDKGLIERTASDEDRRKVTLTLSKAGLAMIGEFLPAICALLERQTATLKVAEMAQMEKLLKKFLDQLEQS
ncbi:MULTISPECIES: MarR family winged helix-turn-helix transcriptional regulator [Rhodanobacter]|jgi:MarR family transcriptional repressor of emrRAB|uniref:MarR family transcriptional regulator n=1 Tax=Rhodanobacter glycinis TaxID=582702 RepID=A0A1I4B1J6_9GAMM|nr:MULTISPECIES: MarR family transcriptional regulator [Rhodanobacter]EIL89605.1 MarR family transcriptional regulator [Rhodanobacter sp. 115]QEE23462.1 MarR family transcriptional regulator [Rhodanobacter glycinis]TAM21578.1 MAG: MarR family transcriptional regulator [Rhodanobacter sp.]SFK61789.1 transcriptional regulator, MarR family [Rhodanobacter glycinis]